MVNPASPFRVTTPYGRKGRMWRWLGFHTGQDYACPTGTVVRASHAGTVEFAALTRGSFGRYVRLGHGGGVSSYYCHLSAVSVRPGQRVDAGAVLGRSGQTGNVSGPHLHYEERTSNGMPRPPAMSDPSGQSSVTATVGPRRPVVWWDRLAVGVRDSDSVRHLQRRLNQAVDADLPITGNYLALTSAAVAAFQRRQGWTGADADGRIHPGGKETSRRLFPESKYDLRFSSSKDVPVFPGPGEEGCGDFGYDPAAEEDVVIDADGSIAPITLVGQERLTDALRWWLANSSAPVLGGEVLVVLDDGRSRRLPAGTTRAQAEALLA